PADPQGDHPMSTRSFFLVSWFFLSFAASNASAGNYEFQVQFAEKVRSEPFTGRVYLFFEKSREFEPRRGPNWFRPAPFVALDVENWKPVEKLAIGVSTGASLLVFPKPLEELDLTEYRVQAVARFDPYERRVGTGPGNGYSTVAEVAVPTDGASPQQL